MEEIIVYTKPNCSQCDTLKTYLTENSIPFVAINMMELNDAEKKVLRDEARKNRQTSMPIVYINGKFTPSNDVYGRLRRFV